MPTAADATRPLPVVAPYDRHMVAALLALVISLIVPLAPPTEGCPDVHIIGARGSGQPSGYGEQVEPVIEALVDGISATGRSVTDEPLDYPAISISDSFGLALLNGEYAASVRSGAIAVWAEIGALQRTCPSTDLVLVGYSQGAQAIKAAVATSTPGIRVASVVLLADPTRDPTQAGVVRLGDPAVDDDGSFGAVPFPNHIRPVAVDVCAEGDGICERGRQSLIAHTQGYGSAAAWVLPHVLGDIGDRPLASQRPR